MARDQAESLRKMHSRGGTEGGRNSRAKRIAITSGKGGVGKSNVSLNLAIALGRLGKKVLLVDADTNLANIDILMGVRSQYTLMDVVFGSAFFSDAILQGPEGIHLLPGSSGVVEMVEQDREVRGRLIEAFAEFERTYDLILIDTGAGLSESVIDYVAGGDEVVLVTNSEPTSITDAYAMIKIATHRNPLLRMHLLVNLAKNQTDAVETFEKLKLAVKNFLQIDLDMLGFLPIDPNIREAVDRRVPFLLEFPRTAATSSMMMIARKLIRLASERRGEGEESTFIEKMLKNKDEE